MRKILIVNGSPRGGRSQSRRLVEIFVIKWKEQYPTDIIKFREVGQGNLPHVSEEWIAGAFTNPENRTEKMNQALALSDKLVDELHWADVIVMGVPMYNWSVPSGFKAYMDQVMRIGRTWKFESGKPDGVYVGLLNDKKMYLISVRGDYGYEKGGINEHMNFQSTYVKRVFGIMGIHDVSEVILENEEYGGEQFSNSVQKAEERIIEVLTQKRNLETVAP
ncbi:MAG: NAD(P)H-dependent oxidoreductase [Bacteroidota bacterium]